MCPLPACSAAIWPHRRRGLLGGQTPSLVANVTSKVGSVDDNQSGGGYACEGLSRPPWQRRCVPTQGGSPGHADCTAAVAPAALLLVLGWARCKADPDPNAALPHPAGHPTDRASKSALNIVNKSLRWAVVISWNRPFAPAQLVAPHPGHCPLPPELALPATPPLPPAASTWRRTT